jgi:PncC family amidohydrolase
MESAPLKKAVEAEVGELLLQRGLCLALAESCTGGLVSHRLTNVPGSSAYYLGGINAYANAVKMRLLGVKKETLETYGAVSEETAREMALGARRALQADVAVSITGIAGPGGGSPDKPVGLTWIGLSGPDYLQAQAFIWPGDRLQVKEQSAEKALLILAEYLRSLPGG